MLAGRPRRPAGLFGNNQLIIGKESLMTSLNVLKARWSLRFELDGTKDIAVICDDDGKDLLSSQPFWLPEGNDPVPPMLAFVRLASAAPRLLAALAAILPYAENEKQSLYECWKRAGDNTPKEELEACERAIEQAQAAITAATTNCLRREPDRPDIHEILARSRQIADIWGIEDVQSVRPDLTEEQAWNVLQAAEKQHDANIGINWDVLDCHADMLYGNAPESDEADGGNV
jgi:hypothetical protein